MSFDWSEYLTLARHLVTQGGGSLTPEADLRTAVSRAYYAASCTARNHLRDADKKPVPSGPRVHRYVREQLQNSDDPTRQTICSHLNSLRDLRNHADYEDAIPKLPIMVNRALVFAERILANLATLNKSPK